MPAAWCTLAATLMMLYSENAEIFIAILKGRAAAASRFLEAAKTSKATATVIPSFEALSWAVSCCRWVAVAGVAFMSGCGSSATKTVTVQQQAVSQTAATTQTAVHIYAPYSAEGKLTVSVTKTVAGECFTGSIISQRSDAWRCNDGNELQDPCFAAVLNAHSVVCPQNGPWSGQQALRITLAKGLPSDGANILRDDNAGNPTDPAWAIELTSGARCLFLAGTSNIVAGLRQNYECTGGLSLFGNEARSSEPWTIFGRRGSMGQLTQETVVSIWF